MRCPACREEMIVLEYKHIELDICAFCKGIWFDANELELLLRSLNIDAGEVGRPLDRKLAEQARRCPYCRSKMAKTLMGHGDGVVIDRCANGHGLWFDGGEIDTVIGGLRAPEAGAAAQTAGAGVGSFLADVLLAGPTEKGEVS